MKIDYLQKLKEKLIFLSANPMWGVGLEDVFENFQIFSGENYFSKNFLLNQKNLKIFELKDIFSTSEIFDNKEFQDYFSKNLNNKNFISTFKPEKIWKKFKSNFSNTNYLLEKNIEISEKVENKIKFFEIAKDLNLQIPETEIAQIDSDSFQKFSKKFENFVVQFPFSAAGLGTYIFQKKDFEILENSESFKRVFVENFGRVAKVSKFIEGKNLTINACATKFGTLISFPFAQITGISSLGGGELSSNGTDFSFEISEKIAEKCKKETKKIGDFLYKNGFCGIFGVDFLLSESEDIFVIEVNSRIVFSIPFFTKLEILQNRTPLLFFHYAELFKKDIKFSDNQFEKSFEKVFGSQVIVRNGNKKRNFIKFESGIYDESLNFKKLSIEPKDLQEEDFLFIVNSGFDFFHNEVLRIQTKNSVLEKNLTTKLSQNFENFLKKLFKNF